MENKTPNPVKPNSKMPKFNISWIYGIIISVLLGMFLFSDNTPTKEVNYSSFKEFVKRGYMEKIDVYSSKGVLEAQVLKDSMKYVFGKDVKAYEKDRLITVKVPAEEFSKFNQIAEEKYGIKSVVEYKEGRNYYDILWGLFPILLLILFFVFMNRRMSGMGGGAGGGGIFNVGKSKAQLFDKGDTTNKITFKYVAGLA